MRVMAVDYGDARTGIAFSDLSCSLAGEALVIHSKNMKETARRVSDEAKSRDVFCVVVGYPKNMDGSAGASAEKCETFAGLLREHLGAATDGGAIEVKLWDERLTTVSAHRILSDVGKRGAKRKNTVDAVAASLILESYLATL